MNYKPNIKRLQGFTVIELMISVAFIAFLLTIALPSYQNYQVKVDLGKAINDIEIISLTIKNDLIDTGSLPDSLSSIGMDGLTDPWGNPYEYINHDTAPPGHRRKDKNLVPINNDFDLYSVGEDGVSSPPLTSSRSHDDIIRANNGSWIGKAEDY